MCDRVDEGACVVGRPIVHNQGRIEIGRHVTLRSLGAPVRLVARPTGAITLGDDVLVEAGAHVHSERRVRIEDGVVIGAHAVISDRDERGTVGEVVIEAGAHIGTGARVLGPCRVGRAAHVMAGATVRVDVAPGSVVGAAMLGEPAEDLPQSVPDTMPAAVAPHANGVGPGRKPDAPLHSLPVRRVRALLAADSTIDELATQLGAPTADGLLVDCEVAPFDQVVQTLVALRDREPKVELAVVWTQPDRVCASFRDLLGGKAVDVVEQVFVEVDAFATLLRAHAGAARFVFVPSWVLPPWRRGTGMLELRGDRAGLVLMKMNLRLAEALADVPNVFLLDAQRWLAAAGEGAFEPKLWHAGKVAFTGDVLAEAARDMHAALRGLLGMSRKLVVVDLDDTMWGGIVGDVGWENLHLGGHDANGEAFVEFQRSLVALTKRGIALAVVSKNEESTAIEAMRSHPEMVIRPEMLAAYRINWRDKAQNIAEIVQELNLGIQSVVFIDDNPIERGRVREALPEAYVPEWPVDPTHYPRALESLRCFDAPHISAEDVERNAMYATERERTTLRGQVSSIDEWLATLDLVVRFERLVPSNIARATQLLNKTNQLNLRTRRLSESELLAWSKEDAHEAWATHVSDRFGNAGLTGLLGIAREGDDVHMVDYVLSCRVMGRRVEETMVWAAQSRAARLGGRRLVIEPIATAKNKPCLDFFARLEGQAAGRYVRATDSPGAPPAQVRIEGLE